MIYLLTILYFLSIIMGQKEQLNDLLVFSRDKVTRNTRWKFWENIQKSFFFIALGIYQIPWVNKISPFHWQDLQLAIGISIAFFEIGTNIIGLHRHWLYNGASSKFDKWGKWKWIVTFAILALTIFIYFKYPYHERR